MPYNPDKGKGKRRESIPKLKCFICDGSYLESECFKKEVLNALIRKSEERMRVRHA